MAISFKGFRLKGLCLLATLLCFHAVAAAAAVQQSASKSYVVYMGSSKRGPGISQAHLNKLTQVIGSEIAAMESLIYNYDNFDAFTARLTPQQAVILAAHEDVISVTPSEPRKLHTTHSWSFLGLEDNIGQVPSDSLWTKSSYGKDVVIGVVDSGVWPESASFGDAGFGPIPAKWKGECSVGDLFGPSYCNRKLIGGQYFLKGYEAAEGPLNTTATRGYRSARDANGHGTHTSSTAGGSFVPGVNLLGFANGTAKGGAPMARVAMYKVCWEGAELTCYTDDILAGIDKGISDGVDVFSISLGRGPGTDRGSGSDLTTIGAFHAVMENISVVASAGNDGPDPGTVDNASPWITTVAASTIDRTFPSTATLGNGTTIAGISVAAETLENHFYPLVSGEDVSAVGFNSTQSLECLPGSLDPSKVSGKIVLCRHYADFAIGKEVQNAGGVAIIVLKPPGGYTHISFTLPAIELSSADHLNVRSYINSTRFPVAKISGGRTVLGYKPAPQVTYFSSQGPNLEFPSVLKPDIAAPGSNILAALSQVGALADSSLAFDTRRTAYTLMSGTSMACPHVAGAIASLKAYHPTWSPAALHSALITTATTNNNIGERIQNVSGFTSTPFEVGSGQLNPNGAAEPGLVYDNPRSAYYDLLCSMGDTRDQMLQLIGHDYNCSAVRASVSDFNYPSLTVSNFTGETIVKRTVTNVGNPTSTYTVSVESPQGIETTISPSVLKFSALGEEITFTVKLKGTPQLQTDTQFHFGSFTWSDGVYRVRSPLVVGL